MSYAIRELRDLSGLTQKAFAEQYGIPVSTLRKWEQGEASPAPYVVRMLAELIPAADASLYKITGEGGAVYYYDEIRREVSDASGNRIIVRENLKEIKKQNLPIYLEELFRTFYDAQDKFNDDCRYDLQEDIIWIKKGNADGEKR